MHAPEVDRSVRLLQDIPELGLRSGAVGVVCSTWFAPGDPAYEVEFRPMGKLSATTRALLQRHQIQSADEASEALV